MNHLATHPARLTLTAFASAVIVALACFALSPGQANGEFGKWINFMSFTSVPDGRIGIQFTRDVGLTESRATGNRPGGRVGFSSGGRWYHATRLTDPYGLPDPMILKTNDPAGRRIKLEIKDIGNETMRLRAEVLGSGPEAIDTIGIGFGMAAGERLLGFGERSDHVDQRGNEIENYVGEGPFQETDYPIIKNTIPAWGFRERSDATYFPMPWFLSTRGYGVLARNAETSRFRLGTESKREWSFEADARRMTLFFFAGPRPAGALRRMTERVGRQPEPKAPWIFGPWFQTGHQNTSPGELDYIEILRNADAPVSAVETHMRYMPCGSDLGQEAVEKNRVASLHAGGLAAISYTREAICETYSEPFDEAIARNAFIRKTDGTPYLFNAFVGSGVTRLGMLDFTNPAAQPIYAGILDRAYAAGYDGWMEDYGEYAPPDSVSASGIPGKRLHNLHPVFYHRAGLRYANSKKRPIVSFVRSGFTGSARHSQIVWGGDPTTGWDFDGLRSSVTEALTMGLSGVSTWGSDIGGFFSFSPQKLDTELLARWVEFGAFSGVMRSKAEGIGATMDSRPQIWEEETLPVWRRYAKLRTQLYPYLAAASATYQATGMPIMRHLALTSPNDRKATGIEDQFMFGPSLLVSPVLTPGATSRRLYLPKGKWVDFWRAISYGEKNGSFNLGRAKLVSGGREVKAPAPLEEIPVMARAGTLLPLLPADTETLAPYAKPVFTGLDDNRRELHLIALPRDRSSTGYLERGLIGSREGRRSWNLKIRGAGEVKLDLDASLRTLKRPFRPGSVKVGGKRLKKGKAWTYNRKTGVLHVNTRLKPGQRLSVSAANR